MDATLADTRAGLDRLLLIAENRPSDRELAAAADWLRRVLREPRTVQVVMQWEQ
jgi:hypothetical protein